VPRDLQHPQGQGKQVRGLYFPWQNSKFGAITIEDIIKQIRKTRRSGMEADGHRLPDGVHPAPGIRVLDQQQHPFQGGRLLRRLHMPYTIVGVHKVSDHRVMSPVQADMKACKQCHAESPTG